MAPSFRHTLKFLLNSPLEVSSDSSGGLRVSTSPDTDPSPVSAPSWTAINAVHAPIPAPVSAVPVRASAPASAVPVRASAPVSVSVPVRASAPVSVSVPVPAAAAPSAAPSAAAAAFAARYRCLRCLKLIRKRDKADHMLSHRLDGPLSVQVADGRKCTGCRDKKRRCRVARVPLNPETKTMRCHCCVAYKERCSFVGDYANACISANATHPALT